MDCRRGATWSVDMGEHVSGNQTMFREKRNRLVTYVGYNVAAFQFDETVDTVELRRHSSEEVLWLYESRGCA